MLNIDVFYYFITIYPKDTIIEEQIAPGTPKPATPSNNAPKQNPIISRITLLSGGVLDIIHRRNK